VGFAIAVTRGIVKIGVPAGCFRLELEEKLAYKMREECRQARRVGKVGSISALVNVKREEGKSGFVMVSLQQMGRHDVSNEIGYRYFL